VVELSGKYLPAFRKIKRAVFQVNFARDYSLGRGRKGLC
jgi:hypothetical protein